MTLVLRVHKGGLGTRLVSYMVNPSVSLYCLFYASYRVEVVGHITHSYLSSIISCTYPKIQNWKYPNLKLVVRKLKLGKEKYPNWKLVIRKLEIGNGK